MCLIETNSIILNWPRYLARQVHVCVFESKNLRIGRNHCTASGAYQRIDLLRLVDCGRAVHDDASMYTYVQTCPFLFVRTDLTWLRNDPYVVSTERCVKMIRVGLPFHPSAIRMTYSFVSSWCKTIMLCTTTRWDSVSAKTTSYRRRTGAMHCHRAMCHGFLTWHS